MAILGSQSRFYVQMQGMVLAGTRLLALSIAILRLFAAILVLVVVPPAPARVAAAVPLADFFILIWTTAGLGAFLIGWPRTRRGLLITAFLDLLFACCALLHGAPGGGMLPLLLGGLWWRAYGGRMPISPMLPVYLLFWAVIWQTYPQLTQYWIGRQPDYHSYIAWAGGLAFISLVATLNWRREAQLAGLRSDTSIDPFFSTGTFFALDFTKWTERVAALYGSDTPTCIIGLLNRSGKLSIFANRPFEIDQAALIDEISKNNKIPQNIEIVKRIHDFNGKNAVYIIDNKYLFHAIEYSNIFAKRFCIGNQKGLLFIAYDGPLDDALIREMTIVNAAFDEVADRAERLVNMRTAYLVDAREVARRDLHDGVLQSLAAIRMRLLTIVQTHAQSDPQICGEIRSAADIVALEQSRLRALLQETMDEDLPQNLVETLNLAIRTIALQWEITIDFSSEEDAIPMHRESVNNIELLIREIVANASKHTHSLHLTCLLAIRDSDLIITLKDMANLDGKDQAMGAGSGPLSSSSLRQRLAIVNGRAYSEGLSSGTLLSVAIPMTYDEK